MNKDKNIFEEVFPDESECNVTIVVTSRIKQINKKNAYITDHVLDKLIEICSGSIMKNKIEHDVDLSNRNATRDYFIENSKFKILPLDNEFDYLEVTSKVNIYYGNVRFLTEETQNCIATGTIQSFFMRFDF